MSVKKSVNDKKSTAEKSTEKKKSTKKGKSTPKSDFLDAFVGNAIKISSSARERFADARDKVVLGDNFSVGIGCLGEKTAHAAIKLYLEPDTSYHEKNVVGRMVADVRNEAGIFEVQTQAFGRMKNKLEKFLALDNVTVVYPCVYEKWCVWVDNDGNVKNRNKYYKKGNPYSVFYELYQIRELLCNEKLRIVVLMLNVDEYRLLNGYGKHKKIRATKCDRIPLELVFEFELAKKSDYLNILPQLPEVFSAADLKKAIGVDNMCAYGMIAVYVSLGLIEEAEFEGRGKKYKVIGKSE